MARRFGPLVTELILKSYGASRKPHGMFTSRQKEATGGKSLE